jgi:hypothetical protein
MKLCVIRSKTPIKRKCFLVAHARAIVMLAAKWTARSNDEGRQVFCFDTFTEESFWGGRLRLHQVIEGARLGSVGPGVSPKTALTAVVMSKLLTARRPSKGRSSRYNLRNVTNSLGRQAQREFQEVVQS